MKIPHPTTLKLSPDTKVFSSSFSSSSSNSDDSFSRTTTRTRGKEGQTAFTLIEIAISLAIIGFALVAIIGVLPLGLEVQRDNREETVINHDSMLLMDAIRNGARGYDDLTNYIYEIRNYWAIYESTNAPPTRSGTDVYDRTKGSAYGVNLPDFRLDTGGRIVGLLSMPKLLPNNFTVPFVSNHVVAFVRSINGPAVEKAPQADAGVQELTFSYRLVPTVVRPPSYDLFTPYAKNLESNLSELRLFFRWPLLPNGEAGASRQSYRSMVGGRMIITNDMGQNLFFFQPSAFTSVP